MHNPQKSRLVCLEEPRTPPFRHLLQVLLARKQRCPGVDAGPASRSCRVLRAAVSLGAWRPVLRGPCRELQDPAGAGSAVHSQP